MKERCKAMNIKEIRKAIRNLQDKETTEINGYTVRRCGKAYGLRVAGDYCETPYSIYDTQKEIIEALAEKDYNDL